MWFKPGLAQRIIIAFVVMMSGHDAVLNPGGRVDQAHLWVSGLDTLQPSVFKRHADSEVEVASGQSTDLLRPWFVGGGACARGDQHCHLHQLAGDSPNEFLLGQDGDGDAQRSVARIGRGIWGPAAGAEEQLGDQDQ